MDIIQKSSESANKTSINNINIKPNDINNLEIRSELPKNKTNDICKWINENNFMDTPDDISSIPDDCNSIASSSIETTSTNNDINTISDRLNKIDLTTTTTNDSCSLLSNNISNDDSELTNNINNLKETITKISNVTSNLKNIGNISVENSRDIHIGNVTYITGPIHVTNTNGGNIGQINSSNLKNKTNDNNNINKEKSNKINCGKTDAEFNEESIPRENSFLGNDIKCKIRPNTLRIINRRQWLAQKPMNPYELINGPVPYVIIYHTATENPTTQPENTEVIRYIQMFHIESKKWDDIGYNFLIGGDGQAYEGRGWGVVGAHSKGYNRISIGIAFVGCFMKELPTETSMMTCKLLIQSGVEQGYIAENYKLIGQCQCSPTESPGRMLFDVIKTWPHFSKEP